LAKLEMQVNGRWVVLDVAPSAMLVEVLRENLGLRGTKVACKEGECGACTVLLDGKAVVACLTPALKANGRAVTTIEGLGDTHHPHPLQKAFAESGAVQCGFCTPGMIMSAAALLGEKARPTREEIRRALVGNLCRCTGYQKIIEAVETAAREVGSIRVTKPDQGADRI